MGFTESLIEDLHLATSSDGKLGRLLEALGQVIEAVDSELELIKQSFEANEALGSDLDSIAPMTGLRRLEGESDEHFRTRLVDRDRPAVLISDVKEGVKDITGYEPEVKEYPVINFVTDYGLPRNTGVFLLDVPLNTPEKMAALETEVNRIKGAGMAFILEHFPSIFEDALLTREFFKIGISKIGYTNYFEPSGYPLFFSHGWGGDSRWGFTRWGYDATKKGLDMVEVVF